MAASAVIALAAFSRLGSATPSFPLSYDQLPCSVWGLDGQIHVVSRQIARCEAKRTRPANPLATFEAP